MKSAPTDAPAAPSRCRGAFYMRPDRTAGINGLAVIATRPWRHEGMPPYEAGRGCGGNRGPVRADMKSAPTDAPAAPSRCRGAFYMRPDRTAGINGLAVIATRPWRHEGMPPYEAGRGCGGNRGPARADMKSAPTDAPAAPSRCRGAFYMRPDRTAGINGLAVIATRPWRHEGMPPYNVRRWCGGNRGPARADMKSAPTDAPAAPSHCRGAFYMRPDRTAGINGLAVIATRPWRHEGMPPYNVRRWCGGNRGPARADMKSAPTDAPAAPSHCRGAFYMRPDRTVGINGLAVIAARHRRHEGMPPYNVRRGAAETAGL